MGGTTESVGNKLRARALELQAELDRKTSDLERVRAELDSVRRINTDAHKENTRLAGVVWARDAQLKTMRRDVELATEQLEIVTRGLNTAHRDRDILSRQRDAALSQVALLETLSRNVAVAPATSTDVTDKEDTRDASEVRFSLLELDKP